MADDEFVTNDVFSWRPPDLTKQAEMEAEELLYLLGGRWARFNLRQQIRLSLIRSSLSRWLRS